MLKGIVATLGVALLLGGCATSSVEGVAGVSTQALHTACAEQGQAGCLEVRALNYREDKGNLLLARYVRSPATDSERQWRMQYASPELWQAYMKGNLQAAGDRTFRYFVWEVNNVRAGDIQAYRVNGKNVVTKVRVRDVTGMVPYPITGRGVPKVYEVDAVGLDAVGASIQFPWAMFTDNTMMLICATDYLGVYPSGKVVNGSHEGLWWTKESIQWLRNMDGKGKSSVRTLSSFVSTR